MRDAVRQAFEGTLTTDFGGANPSVVIQYENVRIEQPKAIYVAFRIQWMRARRASIGTANRFERHHGSAIFEIRAPEDTGTKGINDIADDLDVLFSEKMYSLPEGYITCYVSTANVWGEINADGYYIASVVVPFHIDITRS